MILTAPFNTDFAQHFTQGLQKMLLEYDELGVFILILANALYDAEINDILKEDIKQCFDKITQKLNYGGYADVSEDDLVVFKKIQALGLDQLEQVQFRQVDHWRLQFNPLRALRPPRIANAVVKNTQANFDGNRFHFDKAFLKKEFFWQGTLLNKHLTLLYNKFPFAPLHCLLVPEIAEHHAQFLNATWHQYIWDLTQALAPDLPNIGFGYNGLGAYSSVNHLHFHFFIDTELNIEKSHWQHQGGPRPYPADCFLFDNAQQAWLFIEQQQQNNVAYNLFYRPNKVFVLQRHRQGQSLTPAWCNSLAWQEMAGGFTLYSKETFDLLSAELIEEALSSTKISV